MKLAHQIYMSNGVAEFLVWLLLQDENGL